jgi:Domain of unknown function (DUF4430)
VNRGPLAVLALAALLAGCGGVGTAGTAGRAGVWVTRDRGAEVIATGAVPAGLTAMQGLRRVASVETRYGGRYVQAVEGVAGSLSARRDWFYYVNGYEADRGAAEYRLRAGDVEWWDYRSWRTEMSVPLVVGAFPEPFLHGYDGERRSAVVVHDAASRALAGRVAQRLRARLAPLGAAVSPRANVLRLTCPPGASRAFTARYRGSASSPGAAVLFSATCTDPFAASVHHRYELP